MRSTLFPLSKKTRILEMVNRFVAGNVVHCNHIERMNRDYTVKAKIKKIAKCGE